MKFCANRDSQAACNWMIYAHNPKTYCIACRLNRTIPSLDDADNARYWTKVEAAKRRLVSQLIALGLPVSSKVDEDPERGLMFDFLRSPPEGPRVMTGHASGLITINVEEADDAKREQIKHDLREPYRTLLGHFRHEVGHYYWDRLVWDTKWLRTVPPTLRRRARQLCRGAQAELRTGAAGRLGEFIHQFLCHDAPLGRLGRDLGPLSARGRQPGHRDGLWS